MSKGLATGILMGAVLLALATISVAQEPKAEEVKGGPDARHRSEAEMMLGSMKDQARVSYAKFGVAPATLTGERDEGAGCGVAEAELKGKHFDVNDKVYKVGEDGAKAALTAEPADEADGFALLVFAWAGGKAEFKWYDTFKALKEANTDVQWGDKPDPAHREVAEQMLGSFKGQARVAYAKMGVAPKTFTGELKDAGGGSNVAKGELIGEHFTVTDAVYVVGDDGAKAAITAEPKNSADGWVIHVFTWTGGAGEYKWYDTLAELKKDNTDVAFGDDRSTSSSGGDADAYALYRKLGRSWTLKSSSKIGDMDELVSYSKYEVVKLSEKAATVKMIMLDKDQKPMQYVQPSEYEVRFVNYSDTRKPEGPAVEMKEETVECIGTKWTCWVVETESAGLKTKSYSSKEYPGLLIKSETTGELEGLGGYKSTTELAEWKE